MLAWRSFRIVNGEALAADREAAVANSVDVLSARLAQGAANIGELASLHAGVFGGGFKSFMGTKLKPFLQMHFAVEGKSVRLLDQAPARTAVVDGDRVEEEQARREREDKVLQQEEEKLRQQPQHPTNQTQPNPTSPPPNGHSRTVSNTQYADVVVLDGPPDGRVYGGGGGSDGGGGGEGGDGVERTEGGSPR